MYRIKVRNNETWRDRMFALVSCLVAKSMRVQSGIKIPDNLVVDHQLLESVELALAAAGRSWEMEDLDEFVLHTGVLPKIEDHAEIELLDLQRLAVPVCDLETVLAGLHQASTFVWTLRRNQDLIYHRLPVDKFGGEIWLSTETLGRAKQMVEIIQGHYQTVTA